MEHWPTQAFLAFLLALGPAGLLGSLPCVGWAFLLTLLDFFGWAPLDPLDRGVPRLDPLDPLVDLADVDREPFGFLPPLGFPLGVVTLVSNL